jgi:hypothetical protein
MKTSSIILTVLFIAAALACWLPVFQTPLARIRVKHDAAGMPVSTKTKMAYDLFFDHVNQIPKLLAPAAGRQ